MDNGAYFVAFLFFGCLPALIYFLIVPFTPWLLSLAALPAFCLGIYNSAKRLNVEKEMVRLGRKWTLQPDRAAFIAGGCALAGSLLLELGWLAFLSERL
ncbi:MAG: hypothetical protein CTY15_11790 [Methylocystis sp.]|nr:MAG: hypothetical protein CTY15_11790 [Methylocystis sp.]